MIHFHRFAYAALLVSVAAAGGSANGQAFPRGISVGDVTSNSAVFWTRASGDVALELSSSIDFTDGSRLVDAPIDAESGNVKLEIADLLPATRYYYRFLLDEPSSGAVAISEVGTFSTFPADDQPAALRFLFTGDSNYFVAPFVAFNAAAKENADLLIWFGDTIYGDVTAGGLGPAKTLADYRAKYDQVRGDPGVQAAARAFPVVVGPDDHEVFNDYAGQDPAVPREQRDAGYRAFFEWMPIRDLRISGDPYRTYRNFRYGSNVEFFVLDGRQYREKSALEACGGNLDPEGFLLGPVTRDGGCIAELRHERTMLGAEQLEWLKQGLLQSMAKVKFIINNVPMSYLGVYPYDRWDGYDAERRDLLHFIDANMIDGVVILTTDLHANIHNPDVMSYFRRTRTDYGLRGRVVIPELIDGPIGNKTAEESVDDVVEGLVGGHGSGALSDFGEGVFADRLKQTAGVTLVDADKLAYAVIEVSEAGKVHLTYRGITPEQAAAGATDASDFYSTDANLTPTAPMCGPCGAPVALLGGGLALMTAYRRRRG